MKTINKYTIGSISSAPIRSEKGINDFYKYFKKNMSWGIHRVLKNKITKLVKGLVDNYKRSLTENYDKCLKTLGSDSSKNRELVSLMTEKSDLRTAIHFRPTDLRPTALPIISLGKAYDTFVFSLNNIYDKEFSKISKEVKDKYGELIYPVLANNLISSKREVRPISSTEDLCTRIFHDYWAPSDEAYDIIKSDYYSHSLYRHPQNNEAFDAKHGFTLVGVDPKKYRDEKGNYRKDVEIPDKNKVLLPRELEPRDLNQAWFLMKKDHSEYIIAYKGWHLYNRQGESQGDISLKNIINGKIKVKDAEKLQSRFKKIFG